MVAKKTKNPLRLSPPKRRGHKRVNIRTDADANFEYGGDAHVGAHALGTRPGGDANRPHRSGTRLYGAVLDATNRVFGCRSM